MSALMKMMGLDGIDFEAVMKDFSEGIASYNAKLDEILARLDRIESLIKPGPLPAPDPAQLTLITKEG